MIFNGEQEFIDFVKKNKHLGFGWMMQVISYVWYKDAEKQGLPPEGAFTSGSCVATLGKQRKKEYLGILEQMEKEGLTL